MAKFRLNWLTGKQEEVEGDNAADAMNRAGYGAGAVRALDFYEEWDKYKYTFEDGSNVEGEGYGIKDTFISLGYTVEEYDNLEMQERIK